MPTIQLNFPNPLNTSVQIGDTAYFSNPITEGTPREWSATTTPHLTNTRSEVIKIGEIINIIPWDNTVSIIFCDMPQDLFNQYFLQITAGGCTLVPNNNPTTSGDCGNYIVSNDVSIAVPQTQPAGQYQQDLYQGVPNAYLTQYFNFSFFFDNPGLSQADYMVHSTVTTPGPYDQISINNDWCLIDNTNPNHVAGYINFWQFVNEFRLVYQGTTYTFNTIDAMLSWLIGVEPNIGIFLGMSYPEFVDIVTLTPDLDFIAGAGGPISGTYSSEFIENCTQGSFIMFSKDNKVNTSSILGYYASVEFRSSSQDKSEIFDVGTEFFESSK